MYGYQLRTHDGAGFVRACRMNIDGGGCWYMDNRGAQPWVPVNFGDVRVYLVFWNVFRCPKVGAGRGACCEGSEGVMPPLKMRKPSSSGRD